jgi:aryl-alcohol dehydrogenase-like predicted oxidoreductase
VPLPAVAIAWVLAWPAVTGAIVGARSPQQVDGWIGGARLTLLPSELDEIAAAIQVTEAGQGPARPTMARPAG